MKIKNLRYRPPSASFMVAVFQAVGGSVLSFLFAVIYLISWLAESFIGSTMSLSSLQLLVLSVLLLCFGIRGCVVYDKYRKLAKVIMPKSEAVTVQQISEELGCTPSDVFVDLSRSLNGRYWSGYDVTDSTFILVDGAKNSGTILADPDFTFCESTRHSRVCFGFFAVIWLLYIINPGLGSWQDYVIAGVISILALLASLMAFPKKITVSQCAVKVDKPEAIKTGIEETDNLLREGLSHFSHLVDLDKTLGNEKLAETVRELLDITRQIFDYVKKQPEKAKRIRQFVTYYLPTAIKLLRNYEELNRQPTKGDNIKESIQKIEGIMDGILSTFRQHLDDLYRDKNIDISADIAVMENMINQNEILSNNNG
ncbi:MAG: 5-bromo-4-chloroindolyl phosphate hydrolysis family protein [Betaproteobacteria bacterium]|nr:5-bromo-4-chloroindolyl phosphate hydrolysis family protein [Betaproteobacteria bacterium]